MMKNLSLLCLIALACACKQELKKAVIPPNFNAQELITKQSQLQHLLTKEMIATVMDIPVDKIEMLIENKLQKNVQYRVLYSWPTGRSIKVGPQEINEYHSFSIGFVKEMTLQDFEQYYGSNKGIQMDVDNLTKQENFDKDLGLKEAQYLAKYAEIRKTQKLSDVGSSAFWETPVNALHVLANEAAFTLTANLGKDEVLAKNKSIALVNLILNP